MGKFCLGTWEPVNQDLESTVRLHPCWCSVEHRFRDSGQPTCSCTEPLRLLYRHISSIERYILEIPSLLIINVTPKIYNKIYEEHLQNVLKHTQDLYRASQALRWLYLELILPIIHLLIFYLELWFYLFLYHAMDALLLNCHYQVVVHI